MILIEQDNKACPAKIIETYVERVPESYRVGKIQNKNTFPVSYPESVKINGD